MTDQVAHQRGAINGNEVRGIDDARHHGPIALDFGPQIVQPVRGGVETLERAAAARPFIGIDRRDDRPDRAIVDRDPVGEQRAIRAPVARIERGGISGHDRHRRFPVKESVNGGRVRRHSSGTAS